MTRNVGVYERIVRILLGIILFAVAHYVTMAAYLTFLVYFVGTIFLLTGIFGWCPFYAAFGVSSRGAISRISKRDIEKAVRDYPVNKPTAQIEQIRATRTSEFAKPKSVKKAAKKAKVTKKKSAKKKRL